MAGCATIDETKRVEGWPELRVVEHYVSHAQMHEHCKPYDGAPLACAVFLFDAGECHLWFTEKPAQWIVEHERLHCKGHDHVGDTDMTKMLRDWEARDK